MLYGFYNRFDSLLNPIRWLNDASFFWKSSQSDDISSRHYLCSNSRSYTLNAAVLRHMTMMNLRGNLKWFSLEFERYTKGKGPFKHIQTSYNNFFFFDHEFRACILNILDNYRFHTQHRLPYWRALTNDLVGIWNAQYNRKNHNK